MTGLLDWRTALRTDRPALQTFTCTSKGTNRYHAGRWELHHPAPWELTVQSRIRHCVKPPAPRGTHIWIGQDADGVGAITVFEELEGPSVIELHLCAVSSRHRHKGGGAAREMINTFLDNVTSLAQSSPDPIEDVGIVAWIHEDNRPCQTMMREFGFGHVDRGPENLQRWAAILPISGADLH